MIDSHQPTITDESGNVNNVVVAPAATHISHSTVHPHAKAVSPKSASNASTPSSPAHATPSAPVPSAAPVPAAARDTSPPSPVAPTSEEEKKKVEAASSAAGPAVAVSSTSSDSTRPSDAGGQADIALKLSPPAEAPNLVVRKPLEARLVPPAPESGCCCTIS
jgi:hypothetical protein